MNHIGIFIKYFRKKINLTQKALADGLCTSKYIYFIEKGSRSPSAELLLSFSDRLHVDVIEAYRYLNCFDPIIVYETIRFFNLYKKNGVLVKLRDLTDLRQNDPDFCKMPWISEIIINKCSYQLFCERNVTETITKLKKFIAQTPKDLFFDYHLAQLYLLLSSAYLIEGDIENADLSNQKALNYVLKKENMTITKPMRVMIQLNYLYIRLSIADFDSVIREGENLLEFQKEHNLYESVHCTYFLLAIASYKSHNKISAYTYSSKAVAAMIINDKKQFCCFNYNYNEIESFMKKISADEHLVQAYREIFP